MIYSKEYRFRGLNRKIAATSRDPDDLATSENARLDEDGGITNREGILKIADSLDLGAHKIDFLYFHEGADGYNYVLVGTNSKLYYAPYDDYSTWTEIKQSGSVAWSNSDFVAVSWEYDNSGGTSTVTWTILSNGTDTIAYWSGGASPATTTTDLITGTNKYLANHMAVIAKRLLLADITKVSGTIALPNYIAVSKADNPQDFDVPASGNSGDLIRTNFALTGIIALPQPLIDPAGMATMGIVFGKKGCAIIVDTGEEDISVGVPFNARTLSSQYGHVGKNLLEVDGKVYFYTGTKFMMTSGSDPIDFMDPIKPDVDLITSSADSKVVLAHDKKNKMILAGVPYNGSTIVNKVLSWSYIKPGAISIDDIPMGAVCEGRTSDNEPVLFVGDSRAYGLVGIMNDSNYVDWFDTSNTTSEYYGTIESAVTSSTTIDCLDPNAAAQSWALDEMIGTVVYFPDLKESRIITNNTAGKQLTLDSAVTLSAGAKYYIGYIPFKAKSAHHWLGSSTRFKLPTKLIVWNNGVETFTMDIGLIPNFSNGEGALTEVSQTAGVVFPITFPLTFGSEVIDNIIDIRAVLGDVVQALQIQFKSYRCAEKVDLKSYTISAIPKRRIR